MSTTMRRSSTRSLALTACIAYITKVEPRDRQTILPPDLFQRYSKLAFWRDLQKSKAYRIVAQGGEQQATAMPSRRRSSENSLGTCRLK